MVAVMTFAAPLIVFPSVPVPLWMSAAICWWLFPLRIDGSYAEPALANLLPYVRNGIDPACCPPTYFGVSNVCTSFCWSALGVSSVLPFVSCVSIGVKVRYLLVYVEPWKLNVGIFDGWSSTLEWVCPRPFRSPNRDSATANGHR